MSSPVDLVSLHVAQTCTDFSPYKGKVKGRMFLEHLLSRLYYRESQGCPLELLPHAAAQPMSP